MGKEVLTGVAQVIVSDVPRRRSVLGDVVCTTMGLLLKLIWVWIFTSTPT